MNTSMISGLAMTKTGRQMSIARQSSFTMAYGNVKRNAVAFVLEENEDNEDIILKKLTTIANNLDTEMENINKMIATMDPR